MTQDPRPPRDSSARPLVQEFEHGIRAARLLLERTPEASFDWRPHPGAMRLGSLVAHFAELPGWAIAILSVSHYDFAEAAAKNPERARTGAPPPATSRDTLLETFDANAKAARDGLTAATETQLAGPWSLKNAGTTIETMTRAVAIRRFVLDHMIHHRGQLTIYLRMCGVSVPGLYGPSADEPYIGPIGPVADASADPDTEPR